MVSHWSSPPLTTRTLQHQPWYQTKPGQAVAGDEVVVVGAGMAGCCAAYSLAERGLSVTLLEERDGPARETSGHRAAIVMPHPSLKPAALSSFYLYAFQLFQRRARCLEDNGLSVGRNPTGVLQWALHPRLAKIHTAFPHGFLPPEIMQALSPVESAAHAGLSITPPALYYPDGAWIQPIRYCQAHLKHAGIKTRFGVRVGNVQHRDGLWQVLDPEGNCIHACKTLLLAQAMQTRNMTPCSWMPLKSARGQLAWVDRDLVANPPKRVICHDGYFIPGPGDECELGATFEPGNENSQLSEADHQLLIQRAEKAGIRFKRPPPPRGRVAFRTQSPDHLPLAGPVPNLPAFLADYTGIHLGDARREYPPGSYLPGLYASVGHPSRGTISCLMAGEAIAEMITGEVSCLPAEIVKAISPARFPIRALKRGHPFPS